MQFRVMLKTKKKVIPLNIPLLKGNEKKYLIDCLKSNYVSSVGPFVREFEYKFSKIIGSKYAVACSSGTSALHLALLSLNIGKSDLFIKIPIKYIFTMFLKFFCYAFISKSFASSLFV